MSWLIDNLGLLLAVGLGLAVPALTFFSLRGTRRVLLSRSMSDRLTHWIAGLLILIPVGRAARADENSADEDSRQDRAERGLFGGAAGQEAAQRQDSEEEIPITEYIIHQWRRREMFSEFGLKTNQQYLQEPQTVAAMSAAEREQLFADLKARETPMADLILEVLQATHAGHQPHVTIDDVVSAWEYRTGMGTYDLWWDAWLWRVTQYIDPSEEPERLRAHFARIEQRTRVIDALTKASFEVRPTQLNPRAWMSKAGPSREVRLAENAAVEAMLRASRRAYAQDIPTTWRRDAVVRLKLSPRSAPATLWRAGKPIRLEAGDTFSFGRLDMLQSSAAGDVLIRDVKFGTLQLNANHHVTVWQLPELLRAAPSKRMKSLVTDALRDDEQAARDLELALPLTHAAIRAGLQASPHAAGAPRLRLILSLFDETVIDNAAVKDNAAVDDNAAAEDNAADADGDQHGARGIPSTERNGRGLGMHLR